MYTAQGDFVAYAHSLGVVRDQWSFHLELLWKKLLSAFGDPKNRFRRFPLVFDALGGYQVVLWILIW